LTAVPVALWFITRKSSGTDVPDLALAKGAWNVEISINGLVMPAAFATLLCCIILAGEENHFESTWAL
jgi:hypothetical protein